MIKAFFKEIMIILLLILAIVLLLGVLFYNYMPSSKTIPAKVEEYALEEEVKTELQAQMDNTKSDEIIKTHQIDSTDLEYYEKTKQYNKGKVNPFEPIEQKTEGNTVANGTTNNTGNTLNTNNTNNNTSGNFLNTTGK